MRWSVLAVLLVTCPAAAMAQSPEELKIDVAYRENLLNRVAAAYDSMYVSAAKGRLIRDKLMSKPVRARYADCLTASCLTDKVTADLQSWSGDKHLKMVFSAKPRPLPSKESGDAAAAKAREIEVMRRRNFGFHNVERLHGNIGYLELGRFDPAADAAPTAAAAMSFLANTDAIVIDLRGNGGGNADMVAHLVSYFLPEQTHLSTMQRRDANQNAQIWSAAAVSAPRYLGKPIYVLTSKRTFSAAEGLTYDLKQYANAKVIGEPTRGGANPGAFEQFDEHFAVFVPTGQMINEKTRSNWEGVGIAPDVAVAASDAKKAAQKIALEELLRSKSNDERAAMWKQALEELK
jgi:retinol-binding protein 3